MRAVHGLGGRLRIEVLTDRPEERFARGAVLHREGSEAPLTVIDARPVADGPGWWLRLGEARDRATAEALRGVFLEADVETTELAPGEVWWHEVIGVPVSGLDGTRLGSVADVYRAGAAEVLVVRGGALGELDVPNVGAVVHEFDPRGGRIVVDLAALDLATEPPPRRPRGRRTRREADRAAAGRAERDRSAGSGGPATDETVSGPHAPRPAG